MDYLLSALDDIQEYKLSKPGNFLVFMNNLFHRNVTTYVAVRILSDKKGMGDNCLDLARRMLEDAISMEYMLCEDKEAKIERFKSFFWIEMMKDTTFTTALGIPILDVVGDQGTVDLIETEYKSAKIKYADFTLPNGEDLRTWSGRGKSIESMLDKLHSSGFWNETDFKRIGIGYVFGSRKNHTSPIDVYSYSNEARDSVCGEALDQALLLAICSLVRISTRYIDEIRHHVKENVLDGSAKKVLFVLESLDGLALK